MPKSLFLFIGLSWAHPAPASIRFQTKDDDTIIFGLEPMYWVYKPRGEFLKCWEEADDSSLLSLYFLKARISRLAILEKVKGPEREFLLYWGLDISSDVVVKKKGNGLMAKIGSEGVVMGYKADDNCYLIKGDKRWSEVKAR